MIMTFIFNYWVVFIIWFIGKFKSLYLVDFFIFFMKTFLFGIIVVTNVKFNGFLNYFKYFIVDFFIYYSLLICLLYQVLLYNTKDNLGYKYDFILVIYTIWCFIYSLICSFIGSKL